MADYYHKIMKRDLAALRTSVHYVGWAIFPCSPRYACLTGQTDSPAVTEQDRSFAKGDTTSIYLLGESIDSDRYSHRSVHRLP